MKIKTKCQECGGHNLRWQSTVVNNSDVQQGRLRTHEMGVLFFLGCDDCSATVQHATGDQIARHMNDAAPFAEVAEVDARESARYRLLRRGQHWSVIDGKGDVLRGDELDATIDARLAAQAAAKGSGDA